jgi:hypothetical protein
MFMGHSLWAQNSATFKVLPGQFHQGGKIIVTVLPDDKKFDVEIKFDVIKKGYVPVPSSLLQGSKTYEFPAEFRTEAGYKHLQEKGTLEIPKAVLKFIKRLDEGDLKQTYLIEVLPTNKKSKIEIMYHPSLPSAGWKQIKLTMISNIPFLGGYELRAEKE